MSDRELLEAAAKSAGYDVDTEYYGEGRPGKKSAIVGEAPVLWNPLTDDGDALRLAVKMQMKVYPGEAHPWCKNSADYQPGAVCDETECADPYAATRRAIVRAAAAMAKEASHD